MKKIALGCLAAIILSSMVACHDSETYADQKKRERTAIRAFIEEQGINVISEKEFLKDTITNVSKNEFVLFENTGVYMQIVRKGCGEKIKQGETANVLCRFNEYNLLTDSLFLTNNILAYSSYPDKMAVTNTLGTFTATFVSGTMMTAYSTTSVPAGWLIPLSYVNVGRMIEENDELAKVNLIVPHSQGTSYALSNVQPCFYELTYQRGL
ncbi:MAG: DUF4827 domain-containing protein [Prevotella sp.]|nr:DUF4827 domain-containing protein [Prevotella sp.]